MPVSPQPDSRTFTFILPSLSFKNLTFFAECPNPEEDENLQLTAESTLKGKYPNYTNLKKAYRNRQYPTLIDNVINRVLPLLPEMSIMLFPKNKNTYHRLLLKIGPYLRQFIDSYLFSAHGQNDLNPLLVHDLVFHFCQYNTREAGELLNKHALQLWNTGNKYLAHYLIEYGADVNALSSKPAQSTLFHAVTFNSSADFIRQLIDHGADYSAYQEIRHGIHYDLMLISALNLNKEALTVLIEKFPQAVASTLQSLETMLIANNNRLYTCEMGPYKTTLPKEGVKEFYTVDEIQTAKKMALEIQSAALEQSVIPVPAESKDNEVITRNRSKPNLFGLRLEVPPVKGASGSAAPPGKINISIPSSP